MPLDVLLAFVGVTTLLFLTPGPSMTLILANGAAHGVRAGIITVLGNAAGCAVLLAMVLGGLHLVVRHFEAWFPIVRYAGAAYLFWLGVSFLRKSMRAAGDTGMGSEPKAQQKHFYSGIVVAFANPTALLFLAALLPQFIDPGAERLPQSSAARFGFHRRLRCGADRSRPGSQSSRPLVLQRPRKAHRSDCRCCSHCRRATTDHVERIVMARTAFYPGSFDPVTFGHLDIIARAARIVDRLVLGIGVHAGKDPMIPIADRLALLERTSASIAAKAGVKISVVTFDDLVVDAARRAGAGMIIRGLRDATDFDYEVQMGQMNAALAPDIETIFMAANPATRMISSSLVKQIARMGGDIGLFVPQEAVPKMADAMKRPR